MSRWHVGSSLLASFLFVSCTDSNSIRGDIAERAEGKVATAIIANDGGGGATVPWVQRVYLQRSSTVVEVLKAIHAKDLTISWSGDRRLSIHMTCGEILSFVNVFDAYSSDRDKFERVEVHLDADGLCAESWPPE